MYTRSKPCLLKPYHIEDERKSRKTVLQFLAMTRKRAFIPVYNVKTHCDFRLVLYFPVSVFGFNLDRSSRSRRILEAGLEAISSLDDTTVLTTGETEDAGTAHTEKC